MRKERTRKLVDVNDKISIFVDDLNFITKIKNSKGRIISTFFFSDISSCLEDLLNSFTLENITTIEKFSEFEKDYSSFKKTLLEASKKLDEEIKLMKDEKESKKNEDVSVDELIKSLNKEFGENSVVKIKDIKTVSVDTIPTGSFALNIALGVGGLPKGRIVEIFGPESGGKTTLALSVIANAQKMGITSAFIDVECTFDPTYASKMDVDVPNLLLNQPNSAEEALIIVERMIKSGKVGLIVIDSVAALEPKPEVDADIGSQTIGLKARLMSQAMRKLSPIAFKNNVLVVFINQVRMMIGQSWGNPETTPGGSALKFHSSVRIDVRKVSPIKDGEEIVGILIRAKVAKNKVAPPFRKAEFCLLFGEGISEATDVFNIALDMNILEKKGNTYFYKEEKLGVGLKKSIEMLKENEKLKEDVKNKIIEIKNEKVGEKIEEEND